MVDNRLMLGRKHILIAILLCVATAFPAQATQPQCLLCGQQDDTTQNKAETATPLRIELASKLNFSRIALTGDGGAHIAIDPRGSSNLDGQAVQLGGYPEAGTVMLYGEPGRRIRVDMPNEIAMLSSTGGRITIQNIRTTLGPSPQLDHAGRLEFSFGGELKVSGNLAGRFRGRIPITANYE